MSDTALSPSQPEKKHKPKLFASRLRVYPWRVAGTFRTIKWIMLWAVLLIYYGTPWIRWERAGDLPDQAVLIDMANRRAYFFFIEIWPQDIYLITGLLILAALTLFFVTSLLGRVWCAYACPQTVWTDLYMWIERKIEGDGPQRRKADAGKMTASLFAKKTAKHSAWLAIALATGGAWIFYFQNAPDALPAILTGQAGSGVYFFIGLFTATTYLLGGWAREQVCTYMCPWPRFQAAMFDEDTFVVTYQAWRGEPRSRHAKRQDVIEGDTHSAKGACVDCGWCVNVCPTGIDIRDGVQLECIGCGLCIDACNNVMDKLGREPFLIRHDTQRNIDNLEAGKARTYRLLRPRTVIYAALLAAISAAMIYALVSRAPMNLDILADRGNMHVLLSDGSVRNGYTLKIMNKTHDPKIVTLSASGLEGAKFITPTEIAAAPDSVTTTHIFLTAPAKGPASAAFTMALQDENGQSIIEEPAVFRRPTH